MSTVPAGWYADPSGQPDLQRWWDGTAWTDHVHPTAPVEPAAAVAVATLEPVAADVAPADEVPAAVSVPAQASVPATTWPTAGTTWPSAGIAGGDGPAATTPRSGTDPLAVVALVAGLLWLFGLGAVAAIVCGGLVLKRGAAGTNRTLAIVGLVLGVLGLLPLVLLALGVASVVALPAFLGQADAATQAQLESDLRSAAIEQEMFFTGSGTYLDDASQLQVAVAPGTILSIVRADDTSFCMEASAGAALMSYDSAAGGLREGPC